MPNSTGVGYAEMTFMLLVQRIEKLENGLEQVMNNKDLDALADTVKSMEERKEEKRVLTFKEATAYLGISDSLLYKLTSTKEVPHYKPRGKMLYFDRTELDEWLKQRPIRTRKETEAVANAYVAEHPFSQLMARRERRSIINR